MRRKAGEHAAHKNKNKDRNWFSHPGQSNYMTSWCSIMCSSIFGCDNLKLGNNTYFLRETAFGLKQFLLVCISLGTN